MLSAERLRELLEYAPGTGRFAWRAPCGGKPEFSATDRHGQTYRRIKIDGRLYVCHRLAWLYVHGEWPIGLIDHANGDGLDNRISNLRVADGTQNAANAKRRKDNSSGVKGVYWREDVRKWMAQIQVSGRRKNLGCFADKAAAAKAYRHAAILHFGDFARP